MIPSSVKNERSLWLHAVWSAWKMASERGMGYKLRRQQAAMGGNTCRPFCRPLPLSAALFVPQRLDRIEPRSAAGRIQTESDAGNGCRGQGPDDPPHGALGRGPRQAVDGVAH